jgi:O-antigen/teichoic acid export membrane protein
LTAAKVTGSDPSEDSEEKTLLAQVRTMALDSGVYFIADAAARAVSLVLVLAYTRLLAPTDYGVLAVTSSVTLLLVPVLGLSIVASVTRFYFEDTSDEARRRLYATALVFLLVVPTIGLIVVEALGQAGLLNEFNAVPYDPYLRLAVLAAYFSVFIDLPVAVYIARHQARRVAALTITNAFLLLGSSLLLVVGLHKGVRGILLAAVFSAAAMAVVAIVLSIRMIGRRVRPSGHVLTALLLFSVPLVPHAAAQWVLQISDRLILSRYVSGANLGLYYVGYSIGSVATFLVFAMTKAMSPIITAELKARGDSTRVRRLGTYWFGVIVLGCFLVAIYGADVIKIFAPNRFLGAAEIVPIIALGTVAYGIYTIVSSALWYSMQTGWIPLLTAAAAVVNVGLNLLFIPRFGIKGAAWNTAAGFATLALLQGALAARRYKIAWEYRRWAILSAVAFCAYLVVQLPAPGISVQRYVLSVLVLVAFPVALTIVGFWTREEREWLRRHLLRQAPAIDV